MILIGYIDSDFQSNKDSHKSTYKLVFTVSGGATVWRSIKQLCITESTMKAKYVTTCEVAKEVVWLWKFLADLKIIPDMDKSLTL